MWREEVVGEDLPIGQRKKRQACAGKESQLGASAFKLARIRGDDDVQALIRARGLRKRKRRSAAVQLTPFNMPLVTGGYRWLQQ